MVLADKLAVGGWPREISPEDLQPSTMYAERSFLIISDKLALCDVFVIQQDIWQTMAST